jgi:hypothetical protein
MERREKCDYAPPVCDLCGEAIERPGEVVVRRGIASHSDCANPEGAPRDDA